MSEKKPVVVFSVQAFRALRANLELLEEALDDELGACKDAVAELQRRVKDLEGEVERLEKRRP